MEREMDKHIEAASAVMLAVYRTVEEAESEGKTLDLPVDLCFSLYSWL